MTDENASAPAEGEALPVASSNRLGDAVNAIASDAKRAEQVIQTDVERAVAAVERWYAAHFHAAAVAGRAPITAEDKASLVAHVSEALSPKE